MSVIKEHWLYKDCEFNVDVEEEHCCSSCIHVKVCRQSMYDFCANFRFGTSDGKGCQQCSHRYTRYDNKQPFKCFHCNYYKEKA